MPLTLQSDRAVAIEFELVFPAGTFWKLLHREAEHRLNKPSAELETLLLQRLANPRSRYLRNHSQVRASAYRSERTHRLQSTMTGSSSSNFRSSFSWRGLPNFPQQAQATRRGFIAGPFYHAGWLMSLPPGGPRRRDASIRKYVSARLRDAPA